MKKIVQTPQAGCSVAGFLDDSAAVGSAVGCRITQTGPLLYKAPVLGRLKDLESVVERHGIDELFIAAPTPRRKSCARSSASVASAT